MARAEHSLERGHDPGDEDGEPVARGVRGAHAQVARAQRIGKRGEQVKAREEPRRFLLPKRSHGREHVTNHGAQRGGRGVPLLSLGDQHLLGVRGVRVLEVRVAVDVDAELLRQGVPVKLFLAVVGTRALLRSDDVLAQRSSCRLFVVARRLHEERGEGLEPLLLAATNVPRVVVKPVTQPFQTRPGFVTPPTNRPIAELAAGGDALILRLAAEDTRAGLGRHLLGPELSLGLVSLRLYSGVRGTLLRGFVFAGVEQSARRRRRIRRL